MDATLVDKYIEYIKGKGDGKSTVWIRRAAVQEFIDFQNEQRNKHDLREATTKDVEEFMLWLKKRKRKRKLRGKYENVSVTHRNRTLASVKLFFEFLAKNEYVMSNAAKGISLFKWEKRVPRNVMTERQVGKIFSAIDRTKNLGKRDFCIFRLLYHTGIRKGEFENIALWDVDLDEGLLYIQGKFSKSRVVPLGENISEILQDYIRSVRPLLIKKNPGAEKLFATQNGRPLSNNVLPWLTRKYAEKAGLKKNITPHSFRHTFATHMLNRGASIRHIQEILGHEDLSTTEIYTRVSPRNLKEVYDRTHPRAVMPSDKNIQKS